MDLLAHLEVQVQTDPTVLQELQDQREFKVIQEHPAQLGTMDHQARWDSQDQPAAMLPIALAHLAAAALPQS